MISPTKNQVYVQRTGHEETQTSSGIYIAETLTSAKERVLIQAEVKAIGEGVDQVKIGDVCFFPRYEAYPIEANKSKDGLQFLVDQKFIYARVDK